MKYVLPIVLAALVVGFVVLGAAWFGAAPEPTGPGATPTPTAPPEDPEPAAGDPSLPEADPQAEPERAPDEVPDPTADVPALEVEAPATSMVLPDSLGELRTLVSAGANAARAQRLSEVLPQAAADLGLSSGQQAALELAVLTIYEQETQLDALWEETQDPDLMAAKKDGDWAVFQKTLEGLLTPEQLEAYGALDAWAFPGATGRGR